MSKSRVAIVAMLVAFAGLTLPSAASAQSVPVFTDLQVALEDSPDPIKAGHTLSYDVTVRNNGPSAALAAVTIELPDSVVLTDSPQCTPEEDDVICVVLPALLPNGEYENEIQVRPQQVGSIETRAHVTPLLPGLDTDLSNNEAVAQTEVLFPAGPPNCRGREPTIVGDDDGGVIAGTGGNDVIVGLAGNDKIRAGAGNDIVCGGDGDDNITGAAGNDSLVGGGGSNAMNGGKGTDRCKGNGKKKGCEKG